MASRLEDIFMLCYINAAELNKLCGWGNQLRRACFCSCLCVMDEMIALPMVSTHKFHEYQSFYFHSCLDFEASCCWSNVVLVTHARTIECNAYTAFS